MKFVNSLLFACLVSLLVAACSKEDESHEDIVKADLLLLIESLDSPCEAVIGYETREELEYKVNCQSGHQYVISVNPQGRVDVKHKE